MDAYHQLQNIYNQEDFIIFLQLLQKENKSNSSEWENDNLEDYLIGLEGYVLDKKQESLSWRTFAEILLAATIYE